MLQWQRDLDAINRAKPQIIERFGHTATWKNVASVCLAGEKRGTVRAREAVLWRGRNGYEDRSEALKLGIGSVLVGHSLRLTFLADHEQASVPGEGSQEVVNMKLIAKSPVAKPDAGDSTSPIAQSDGEKDTVTRILDDIAKGRQWTENADNRDMVIGLARVLYQTRGGQWVVDVAKKAKSWGDYERRLCECWGKREDAFMTDIKKSDFDKDQRINSLMSYTSHLSKLGRESKFESERIGSELTMIRSDPVVKISLEVSRWFRRIREGLNGRA